MKNAILAVILLCSLGLISGCRQQPFAGRHITVVMKKYSFDPPVIHIKNGETVALDVSTADVQHGFDIPQLGIKEPVQPGRPVTVILKAPAKGEYRVICGIICGPHHDDMVGKLVVE